MQFNPAQQEFQTDSKWLEKQTNAQEHRFLVPQRDFSAELKRLERAIQKIRQELQKQVDHHATMNIIGEGFKLLEENPDAAIKKYNQALERESQNGLVYLHVGYGLFMLGRYASAMLAAKRAGQFGGVDEKAVSKLYTYGHLHLFAYNNAARRGTLNTSIDNDIQGIKQMHHTLTLTLREMLKPENYGAKLLK